MNKRTIAVYFNRLTVKENIVLNSGVVIVHSVFAILTLFISIHSVSTSTCFKEEEEEEDTLFVNVVIQ